MLLVYQSAYQPHSREQALPVCSTPLPPTKDPRPRGRIGEGYRHPVLIRRRIATTAPLWWSAAHPFLVSKAGEHATAAAAAYHLL